MSFSFHVSGSEGTPTYIHGCHRNTDRFTEKASQNGLPEGQPTGVHQAPGFDPTASTYRANQQSRLREIMRNRGTHTSLKGEVGDLLYNDRSPPGLSGSAITTKPLSHPYLTPETACSHVVLAAKPGRDDLRLYSPQQRTI